MNTTDAAEHGKRVEGLTHQQVYECHPDLRRGRHHGHSIVIGPRLRAIIRQRCPVCFQGAMYVSYGIGIVYLGILGLVAIRCAAPRYGIAAAVAAVVLVHFACIPAVFRYSRVIWAHLNVRTMRP